MFCSTSLVKLGCRYHKNAVPLLSGSVLVFDPESVGFFGEVPVDDRVLTPLVHTLILRALSPADGRAFGCHADRFSPCSHTLGG